MSTILPLQNLNRTLASYSQKNHYGLRDSPPAPPLPPVYNTCPKFFFLLLHPSLSCFFLWERLKLFFVMTQCQWICSGWYLSVGWHCYALVGQFRFLNIQAVKNFILSEIILYMFIRMYILPTPLGGRTIWHRTIWHRTIWHQDNLAPT